MEDFGASITKAADAALVVEAMENTGSSFFLMAACHEQRRTGIVCRSLQVCADEPLLVAAAIARGHWIAPVVRDARCFALSSLTRHNKLALRKFGPTARSRDGDPFDVIPAARIRTGAPALVESRLVLDCEVMRHYDLEADHELYIGRVVAARIDGRRINFEVSDPTARSRRPAFAEEAHPQRASSARPSFPSPRQLRPADGPSLASMAHQPTGEPVAARGRKGEPSPGIGRLAHLLRSAPRGENAPGDDGPRSGRRGS